MKKIWKIHIGSHQNKFLVFSDAGQQQILPSQGVRWHPTLASLGHSHQGEKEKVWSCPLYLPNVAAAAVSAAEEQPWFWQAGEKKTAAILKQLILFIYVYNCGGLNPNPHLIFTLQEWMTTNSILPFVLPCCLTSNYSINSCHKSTQILSLINIESYKYWVYMLFASLLLLKKSLPACFFKKKVTWISNITVYKLQWVQKCTNRHSKLFLWSYACYQVLTIFLNMGYWTILVIDYTEWRLW